MRRPWPSPIRPIVPRFTAFKSLSRFVCSLCCFEAFAISLQAGRPLLWSSCRLSAPAGTLAPSHALASGAGDLTVGRGVPSFTITTFNVLAPIFKRVGKRRESEFPKQYVERHSNILEHLQGLNSDVICLQELWVSNPEMMGMYERTLENYSMHALARTEARGDGVGCFVREGVDVVDRQDVRLKGLGGRVALILRLRLRSPGGVGDIGGVGMQEVVVANTHLLFPHERTFSILRMREVKKLLAFMECYTQEHDLSHLPLVLCGDFNGGVRGRVYQYLKEKGFRCAYEEAMESGGECYSWISHKNHLGEELGVDYVWFMNPEARLGPLELGWENIVYQSTKSRLLSTYKNRQWPNTTPLPPSPVLCMPLDGGALSPRGAGQQGAESNLKGNAADMGGRGVERDRDETPAGGLQQPNPGGAGISSLSSEYAPSQSADQSASSTCDVAVPFGGEGVGLKRGGETAGPGTEGRGSAGGQEKRAGASTGGAVAAERDVALEEREMLANACQDLGLSEGMELTDEEISLLLESSADDGDFLVPTILDGSSTGLEGATASQGIPRRLSWGTVLPPPGACALEASSCGIWPPSLQGGVWPPGYNMSDHGSVTATFSVLQPTSRGSRPASSTQAGDGSGEGSGGMSRGDEGWGDNDGDHYGLR
ncbi:unnamed protein product [Discosporangium mesarthrocarpum]